MPKWDVEPDNDPRFAFLTYRDDRGRLLQIPETHEPWNDAYVHMARQSAIHLKTYIEFIVNENERLKRALRERTDP